MPKVSVIIPCYNYGQFLPDCIDSVLAQTFTDWEAIIVDDCSNDGTTPAIVRQQAKRDPRIKAIYHNKNQGVSTARNTAISQGKGEYIMGLDADDKIDATMIEKMLAKMESTDADVVYTHAQFFDDRSGTILFLKDQEKIKRLLPFQSCFPMWALHKKSDWKAVGGYDTNLRGGEDTDYWLNFVEADKNLVLLDEVLYFYRRHDGESLSREAGKRKAKTMERLKQNHPNLYNNSQYYWSFNYFKYVIRPTLFQFRTRKGRRVFRLLGITFYED